MIKTKSIYEPESKDDGLRVLVTRYWPRGVKKNRIDIWLKDLGPCKDLIKGWKSGKIIWQEFRERYLDEYKSTDKQKALKELKDVIKGKDTTLFCVCEVEEQCHRVILKDLLIKN